MVLAAGTTAYNIVELLHILTVLVALAPDEGAGRHQHLHVVGAEAFAVDEPLLPSAARTA